MAHYLLTGCYTAEALRGMVEKAEDRTEASGSAIAAFGGQIDRYFITLDGADFMMIAEFPDNEAALSCASMVIASGTVTNFKVKPVVPMAKMPGVFQTARTVASGYKTAGAKSS